MMQSKWFRTVAIVFLWTLFGFLMGTRQDFQSLWMRVGTAVAAGGALGLELLLCRKPSVRRIEPALADLPLGSPTGGRCAATVATAGPRVGGTPGRLTGPGGRSVSLPPMRYTGYRTNKCTRFADPVFPL